MSWSTPRSSAESSRPTPPPVPLPASTIIAIEQAAKHAPFVAAGPTEEQRETRLQEAIELMKMEMQEQLRQQAAAHENAFRQRHLELEAQMATQAKANADKEAVLTHWGQELRMISNRRSQPIVVPSTSPNVERTTVSSLSAPFETIDPITILSSVSSDRPDSYLPSLPTNPSGGPLPPFTLSRRLFLSNGRQCDRCGFDHDYSSALCTAWIHFNGSACEDLGKVERAYRRDTKVELKFATVAPEDRPVPARAPSTLMPAKRQVKASTQDTAKPQPPLTSGGAAVAVLAKSSGGAAVAVPAKSSEDVWQQQQRKQELLIIKQAKTRLASLKAPQSAQSQAKSARTQEQLIAQVTGDTELLRHGSVRCKRSEVISEDDETEILAELKTSTAHHNMFHPTDKRPVRTRKGYVDSDFIYDGESIEDDEEEMGDDEDGGDDIDDDPTSDYQPEGSVSRDGRDSISSTDRKDWDAFQAWKQSQPPPQDQAVPSTSSSNSTLEVLGSAILQALQLQKSTTSVEQDQHGRIKRTNLPSFDIALHPPVHGTWDDVDHLMKVYMPAYDKYRVSCGDAHFESIWDGYTSTQKTRICKFLVKSHGAVEINGFTNAQYLSVMCREKGYSTTSVTEVALRAIKFNTTTGSLLNKSTWVNHETDWEECLAQGHSRNARSCSCIRHSTKLRRLIANRTARYFGQSRHVAYQTPQRPQPPTSVQRSRATN